MTDRGGRSELDRRIGAVLPALAAFAVAALVVIGIVGLGRTELGPQPLRNGGGDMPEPGPEPTEQATDATPRGLPDHLTEGDYWTPDIDIPWNVALITLLTIIFVLAVALLRRLPQERRIRRQRSRIVGGSLDHLPDSADELRQAVVTARAALDRDHGSANDAVIQAWLALEAAAAATGDRREPSQTPSEFTTRLLRKHHADAEATAHLLDLYHRARFSSHPDIGPADVRTARSALSGILTTLDDHAEHAGEPEGVDRP